MMTKIKKILMGVVALCSSAIVCAQNADTARLSLDSADNIFLRNNLQLLAQKYNIGAQKALEEQARLFPNPNLQFATEIYNPQTKGWFPFGQNGEVTAQLSQEILLAGKRNKQIKIAQANTQLSQVQFTEVLKTLKYTLHTDFYTIYYLHKSAQAYIDEINSLQTLTNGFDVQLTQGNVSQKEALRVKAQLYSLQSEYNDLINQINDTESELRLLLHLPQVFVLPEVDKEYVEKLSPSEYPLQTIIDSALLNHPDIQMAKLNTQINRLNYSYQKALAVPDLSLQLGYDQQGSSVNHFTSLGVAMDLPFFNRNQGNIKSAKLQTTLSEINEQNATATVQENIYNEYVKANTYDDLYRKRDKNFDEDFKTLQQATLKSYQARTIGLLDFLDFYDAYKENVLQADNLQINRMNAFEALNFYSGSNFY
ncbi:hypothetical protein A9P82_04500 [Arachidicoccus ginsenosidimutans]|uniref:TolC family protein n=1 Tax=Arachidicoccus sp. BS20 TaxID=1850526 RepID=UPI0007F075BF|nr:TolC family protein [Arachidicoccus sp. BS20]ANI88611.1 hypothetical protein A9P82_04500 [Arachidicoccus sp. BS20]